MPENWRALVLHRAGREGTDLPPETIDELAAHLEDLYAAALRRGATADEARTLALAVLADSPLTPLDRHAARAARAPRAAAANDTANAAMQMRNDAVTILARRGAWTLPL